MAIKYIPVNIHIIYDIFTEYTYIKWNKRDKKCPVEILIHDKLNAWGQYIPTHLIE